MKFPCISGTVLQTFGTQSDSGVIKTQYSGYLIGRLDAKMQGSTPGRAYLYLGDPQNPVGGTPFNDGNGTVSTTFSILVAANKDIGVILEGDSHLYNCKILQATFQN